MWAQTAGETTGAAEGAGGGLVSEDLDRSDEGPNETEILAVRAKVSGKVQGVFYRASTLEKAQQLGLQGSVENLADGTVRLVAQGEREKVEALLRYAHHGSDAAKVSRVDVETIPIDPARVTFKIEATSD